LEANDDYFVVAHEGIILPLAEALRAIGRISCVSCGRGGLEHHDLDHFLVDPLEPAASAR
jgi:hypothetical protein